MYRFLCPQQPRFARTISPSTSKDDNNPAVSENTPLLSTSTQETIAPVDDARSPSHKSAQNGGHQAYDEEPLPKLQIFILCYARVVKPIAFFGIFPFISEMIFKTGNLEEADVGFYAGLIESVFSLTQMLLMIQWGRAADRMGRKPILVSPSLGWRFQQRFSGLARPFGR